MTEQDVKTLLAKLPTLKAEIGKVIVGQSQVLDEVLVALLALVSTAVALNVGQRR